MLQGRKKQDGVSLTTFLAIAIGLVATPAIQAQDDASPNQGNVSFSAGIDITNAYYFRGLRQEEQGIIAQPWMEATFNLSDTVDLTVGIWNSMHDTQTAASANGAGPDWWYEADLYLGLSIAVSENCSLGFTYTAYTSPSDAFPTINELSFSGSHNDSSAWDGSFLEGSGLQPGFTVAIETDGQADGGSNEGIYLEVGIEPSFTLVDSEDQPITLSIPVTVGLSLGDYYEDLASPGASDDSHFGYLDVGAVLSTPLNIIPSDFGQWEGSLGFHYLMLSESTENFNRNADDNEFIVSFGISMGY